MVICTASTMQDSSTPHYALGSTDAEHDRLIRQGVILSPLTERLFREAGIGPGQRVLDVGSGVGDVAMVAARLVGPSGEVVGMERDSRSIARARARVANAGLRNVSFLECDVSQPPSAGPFDAAVGRFILQFVPDAVASLHHVAELVRPGGVVAFQSMPFYSMFGWALRHDWPESGVLTTTLQLSPQILMWWLGLGLYLVMMRSFSATRFGRGLIISLFCMFLAFCVYASGWWPIMNDPGWHLALQSGRWTPEFLALLLSLCVTLPSRAMKRTAVIRITG